MNQLKNNAHHKAIQSRTKQSKGEYQIILDDTERNETGFFLELADLKIIYNALKQYKPTEKEE
jgi:hypothetical protein